MTPAVQAVRRAKMIHTLHAYTHDPRAASYGLEAAEKLGVPEAQVFKTLVVLLDGRQLAVGVVPVRDRLDMKAMAKALSAKKAEMAAAGDVERATGYVLGGVSPLGQKKRLPTAIDRSALDYPLIYVSAGRRGLDISLSPEDLGRLTAAVFTDIVQGTSAGEG